MATKEYRKKLTISGINQQNEHKSLEVALSSEDTSIFRARELKESFKFELGMASPLMDEAEPTADEDETFFLIGRGSAGERRFSDEEMVDINEFHSFEISPVVVGGL